MPATETTWRDQKKLHFLFAVSGTVLFLSTVWMFAKDHKREWKSYQRTAKDALVTADRWRESAVDTEETRREHAELQSQLITVRSAPIDATLYARFKELAEADPGKDENFASLDRLVAELNGTNDREGLAQIAAKKRAVANEKAKAVEDAEKAQTEAVLARDAAQRAVRAAATPEDRKKAEAELKSKEEALVAANAAHKAALAAKEEAEREAVAAEREAGEVRQKIIDELTKIVKDARFRENNFLVERKFQNANLDKAKADEGLVVRDVPPGQELKSKLERQEEVIGGIDSKVGKLTLEYQAALEYRKRIEGIVKQLTAEEDAVKKQLEENRAALVTLEKAIAERRSTYVVWWNGIPTPGKKVLEAPILDAFNSPLKIENLWSEGLDIDYNFRDVKRYDRCTTCHQMMEKSVPGEPGKGLYVRERLLTLVLTPPTPERLAELKKAAADAGRPLSVQEVYGVAIGPDGLIERGAVSIVNVVNNSLATRARLKYDPAATVPEPGEELRNSLLQPETAVRSVYDIDDPDNPFPAESGLRVGDIFVDVNGSVVRNVGEAERFLIDGATAQKPLHVRVRRGLPNPFDSHPRLDLFVGPNSPHKMQEFGCTMCHEGQGSATDFKWASHTPNDVEQMKKWTRDHGWFDNHHWIYPMNAKRFAESSCLKCHHEVVDLEPSPQFAEAPAPKVVHGYNLIRKYGCYGCHEITGFDGPDKRIGPDLRLEPNFVPAAQQLKADPAYDTVLSNEQKDWVETVIAHPENSNERTRLAELLTADAASEEPKLTSTSHNLAPLLKDVDAPGDLRKPGPSLRFAATKLDEVFLYDWISNPRNFRPSTRMPRVFGLWDHLLPHEPDEPSPGLDIAKKYEPLEIEGIATYLLKNSQKFEYLEPPAEVTAEADAERGKAQFQTRGCLACHSHGDFGDAEAYRQPHEIVQGPDLSRIAEKFDPQRNPDGRKWLYSWIKEPTRYHARTVMPNLYLDPIEVTTETGTLVTDPVADIVAYLMSSTATEKEWKPENPQPAKIDAQERVALSELLFEHLKDAFSLRSAAQYAGGAVDDEGKFIPPDPDQELPPIGIPADRLNELKGAERELVLGDGQTTLSDDQKLNYIGRKSIAKYGCYGCHDVPGFEDAKPIGAGLNDWGRKEPAKLAFEHIVQYLEHHGGHGGGHGPAGVEDKHQKTEATSREHAAHGHGAGEHPEHEEYPEYMLEQVFHGNRIGFLYQKLREPRSYDYHKTETKKYNDRLRMPQFPFNDEDREAVMTFVLGLVADPPARKYIYEAKERERAIIAGQKVLEKYNCQSCHILQAEEWKLAFSPEFFKNDLPTAEDKAKTYPFLLPHVTTDEAAASLQTDRRGLRQAHLAIMPRIESDGRPSVTDHEGEPLDPESQYDPTNLIYFFDLWKNTVVEGEPLMVGKTLSAPTTMIEERRPAQGGFLTRYLLPIVTQIDATETKTAPKGGEAMGWLPPPLIGEGHKVQSDWLQEFLLEPHPIRPAVFMRMPKFNMSRQEAQQLAAYFAAIDNADYPSAFNKRRQSSFLDLAEAEYQNRLAKDNLESTRFDDAMKIVTSNDYCVKCHIVGNFTPGAGQEVRPSPRALAPDLSRVYRRFRPDYLREWIANPKTKLPYTAMPQNIPYDPSLPYLGGVKQELYHGTSIEQVDALVDLLMNFDRYTQGKTDIAKDVKPPMAAPAAGETPAEPPPAEDATTEPAAE